MHARTSILRCTSPPSPGARLLPMPGGDAAPATWAGRQTSMFVVALQTFESMRFIMALICFMGPTS